jgi:hypothetical protein
MPGLPAVESAEELLALFEVPFEEDALAGRRLVLLRGFARRRAEIDRAEADEERKWVLYAAALRDEYQRCIEGGAVVGAAACAACPTCAVADLRRA